MTGQASLRTALAAALARDATVHLVGEALELSPVTQGLAAQFPGRAHLLPASDASLVGVAVGLSWGGARPVVELSGGPAVWGALQQLGQEAAALGGEELRARVVVRVPLAPGPVDLSALLAAIPGLCVACVGRGGDAAALLDAALQAEGPVVLLEPLETLAEDAEETAPLALGRARVLRAGEHATALAWGTGVGAALQAAEVLAEEGISLEVLDLRTLAPLDAAAISESVGRTGRAIVVGGAGPALMAAVRGAFLRLESPPAEVGADRAAVVAAVKTAVAY